MPKFKVNLVKTMWATINVEAETEEEAIEAAFEYAPDLCAHCTGWGQQWSVSPDDDWQTVTEFFGKDYEERNHGKDVEPLDDGAKVVNDD